MRWQGTAARVPRLAARVASGMSADNSPVRADRAGRISAAYAAAARAWSAAACKSPSRRTIVGYGCDVRVLLNVGRLVGQTALSP
jgi:hypothetical protein